MKNNSQEVQEVVIIENGLLKLFDEMTFLEKWCRVMDGIKMPPDTGEYKFASLQIKRLWAPSTAIISVFIALLVLIMFSNYTETPNNSYAITMIEPEKMDERLEQIKTEPPPPETPPEITEIVPNITTPGRTDLPGPIGPSAPFSPQPATFDTVAMIKSPVAIKGIYGGRTPGTIGQLANSGGGGGWTEDAVFKALRWLKKQQESDGSWKNCKPAMTGFALLTYLAHGETPTSEEFGPTVERAIRFLIDNQEPNGHFKGRDGHDYTHPIATYALCEAYGMTGLPQIRYSAQKAVMELLKGQHATGGFNYNLDQSDRDDTSYMAWCAQALKAADMAKVMSEEDKDKVKLAMRKAIKGFQKNYQRVGGNDGYPTGGFGYTEPGSGGLSAAGTLCMQLLGASKEKEVRGSIQLMEAWKFEFGGQDVGSTIYYAYYATQAKFHEGGDIWKKWNAQCLTSLVKNQTVISKGIEDSKGRLVDIGYWDTKSSGHTDGIVMQTCLCTLMLEVYYRYLPTYQNPDEIQVAAPVKNRTGIVNVENL